LEEAGGRAGIGEAPRIFLQQLTPWDRRGHRPFSFKLLLELPLLHPLSEKTLWGQSNSLDDKRGWWPLGLFVTHQLTLSLPTQLQPPEMTHQVRMEVEMKPQMSAQMNKTEVGPSGTK
jgi:hypothetical protein